jgi:hypothetical protein
MRILLFLSLLLTLSEMMGQDSLSHSLQSKKWVYAEGGGASFLVGASFDMRIKGHSGLGFRAGFGGVSGATYGMQSPSMDWLTIPIEMNYLVGQKRHYFVTGIGIIPMISKEGDNLNLFNVSPGLNLAGAFCTMGYRYSPIKVGPSFQIAWTPVSSFTGGFLPLWFSLGLGFSF